MVVQYTSREYLLKVHFCPRHTGQAGHIQVIYKLSDSQYICRLIQSEHLYIYRLHPGREDPVIIIFPNSITLPHLGVKTPLMHPDSLRYVDPVWGSFIARPVRADEWLRAAPPPPSPANLSAIAQSRWRGFDLPHPLRHPQLRTTPCPAPGGPANRQSCSGKSLHV